MNSQSERPDELITIAVLIALLLLVGIIGLFWSTWNRVVLAPTATPTATQHILPTETPDVRGTQIASDLAAQESETEIALAPNAATSVITVTIIPTTSNPSIINNQPAGGTTSVITMTPPAPATGDSNVEIQASITATLEVNLPFVIGDNATVSADSTSSPATAIISSTLSPSQISTETLGTEATAALPEENISSAPTTPEPIFVPIVKSGTSQPDETQSPTDGSDDGSPDNTSIATLTVAPTVTLTNSPAPTLAPTETPTLQATPTPTPLPTPTPTPTQFQTEELIGVVHSRGATMRQGPANIYNQVMTLNDGQQVTLTGRNESGEWVYVCCPDEAQNGGWVRQADASPINNQFADDENPPEDADPNDVRWLEIRPIQSGLPPVPQSFNAPPDVFPLLRYNIENQGRLSALPLHPLDKPIWQIRERATGAFNSAVTISQRGVLANSDDGHLYNFSFEVGDEVWRYKYENDGRSSRSPIVSNDLIYAVDEAGIMNALLDRGSSAELRWRQALTKNNQPLLPATDITMLGNFLFVGTQANNSYHIVGLNRTSGALLFAEPVAGTLMHYPAIGGQTIYVATNAGLFAKDTVLGTEVWSNTTDDFTEISTSPVYSFPGHEGLAELYVARTNGEIIALDANTGSELWRFDDGETVTGIGLDDSLLYLSGSNFVKAFNRDDHTRRWRINISGDVPGGPLVGPASVMVVTVNGSIVFIEPSTGTIISESTALTVVTGGYAVTSQYLFLPSPGNTIRAYQNQ